MNKIEDMVAQAIADPGSMVARLSDNEPITRWATRAVLEVLETGIIGLGNSADLPETPAMRALAENAALRDRLRVADDLLHDANGVIFASENLKLTLPCLSSHCVEGEHVRDMGSPQPIGDQDWRDAAKRWGQTWQAFNAADQRVDWRGPDEGDIKLPPPLPPADTRQDDLRDMTRAVEFGAHLLRTELGPGGLMSEELDTMRKIWSMAISCLESAASMPMIPLFFWRERKAKENPPVRRAGIVMLATAALPGACPSGCDGLDGTHTVRNCAGAR